MDLKGAIKEIVINRLILKVQTFGRVCGNRHHWGSTDPVETWKGPYCISGRNDVDEIPHRPFFHLLLLSFYFAYLFPQHFHVLGKHPAINYKLTLNETFLFPDSVYITSLLRVASKLWFSCLGFPGSWDYRSVSPTSAFSSIQASTADWLEKQGFL